VTDAEKVEALIRYWLEQADEALAAATLNLTNGLHRSAVNRVYYAMFYAVLALLATHHAETSKHSARCRSSISSISNLRCCRRTFRGGCTTRS